MKGLTFLFHANRFQFVSLIVTAPLGSEMIGVWNTQVVQQLLPYSQFQLFRPEPRVEKTVQTIGTACEK